MKKKEQKLINANFITRHNTIAISRDPQSLKSSFRHIQNIFPSFLIKFVDVRI